MAKSINEKLLVKQILKLARANRSQEFVNQRLNSTTNQMRRWESGHAKIQYNDFLLLCKILKINISKLLESYFRFTGEVENHVEVLKYLFSNRSISKISKSTGLGQSKLRRILQNKTPFYLEDFFVILFGLDSMESIAFFHDLAKGQTIPTLKKVKEKIDKVLCEYLANPSLGLILIALELRQYKSRVTHSNLALSNLTGVNKDEVMRIIKIASEAGLIYKKDGIYHCERFTISDRHLRENMIKVRSFWTQSALNTMKSKKDSKNAFGSIIFTTSEKARKDIIALYLRFFEDFKSIVENDKNAHDVALVMNFHLFSPQVK